MRCIGVWAAIAMGITPMAVAAQDSVPAAPVAWPEPSLVRYDEDYQALADPAVRATRWTGQFKYIPLGNDIRLTTGVELRAHSESYRNNHLGNSVAPDDSFIWPRALPYADLHIGSGALSARAFVQPMMTYAIGVAPAPGPVDQSRIDLLQGFADVHYGPITLRGGRQMLSLGSERLVGTRYGPNVPQAFDGLRLTAKRGTATLSLFALRPVTPGGDNFDDRRSTSRRLRGTYAALPFGSMGVDIYWLGYRNRAAHFADGSGEERRDSFGLRWFGTQSNWHWNHEIVLQRGRLAGQPIHAWTWSIEAGHSFPNIALAPDFTIRSSMASGDHRAGDGRLNSFNALFPKGKFFGELSPVGPYNLFNFNPMLQLTLSDSTRLGLSINSFWRQSRGDGIYDVPGNLILAAAPSAARFIGTSSEATFAWQATREFELSTALAAFRPGRFLRDAGYRQTIGMLMLEGNFRF